MRGILILAIALILRGSVLADPYAYYENAIYDPTIHTVKLHPVGYPFGTPLLQLHTPDVLVLSFDQMGDQITDFRYKVVQCDHQWKGTGQSTFDYIDGFSDGYITDYDYSFNTTYDYVHYQLELPNQDFRLTQSGNYAIVVFTDDEDEPALVRRFMVVDARVTIVGGVAVTRNPALRDKFQEIVFDINHEGFELTNPYQEINVVVTQNDRWDNAITNIKPLHINENEMLFNYNMKIAFPTGREFRELDIRTLRYRTEGVRSMDIRDSTNIVYLMPDVMRKQEPYRAEGDLNGKFMIDKIEGRHSDLEADYAWVNFQLPFQTQLSNGDFYVLGGFNDFKCSEKNKMTYNPVTESFEADIFLKQGFYNYIYAFVENGSDYKDISFTEGNYYDTENDYAVYVYFRPFGERYDQLIGVSFMNTKLTRY